MYTLSNIKRFESKPGADKQWKKIVANIQDGTEVTIWGSFPNFDSLKDGDTVSGDMSVGEYKGKKQYTLNAIKAPIKGNAGIANAMRKKEESIKVAQENKAEAIKVSSTFRDATLLTTMYFHGRISEVMPEIDNSSLDEVIRAKWQEFREWLWKNYDYEAPPF